MEEPLLIAQRRFDGNRDNVSREKQKLVEQRNRLESEIQITRENIERLDTEASRKSRNYCDIYLTEMVETNPSLRYYQGNRRLPWWPELH